MERRIFDNDGTGPRARGAFFRTHLAPGALLATVALLGACDDDTGMNPQNEEAIVAALEESGGIRTQAARILGMGRTTLWRKLKEYGIESEEGS